MEPKRAIENENIKRGYQSGLISLIENIAAKKSVDIPISIAEIKGTERKENLTKTAPKIPTQAGNNITRVFLDKIDFKAKLMERLFSSIE